MPNCLTTDPSTPRLGILDDHPQFLDAVADSLRDEGWEVRWTAVDLPGALTALRTSPVDAVLIDLTIQGCDGARVGDILRWARPALHVLLHSPFLDETMTATASELGFPVVRKVDGVDGLLRVLAGLDGAPTAVSVH